MKELKKMIIDILCDEYTFDDATEHVNRAEINIKGEYITVKYYNGAVDTFKVVIIERLELVK